jgi:hypothetical protein
MSTIIQSLKQLLVESSRLAGTVVAVSRTGTVSVRTKHGLIQARPPVGATVRVGAAVVVENGNISLGANPKKQPTIYRV